MTKETRLQHYLASTSLEIAKVDTFIGDTDNIPVDELFKKMERRQKLQDLGNYLKYLLVQDKEMQKAQEPGRILTMQ